MGIFPQTQAFVLLCFSFFFKRQILLAWLLNFSPLCDLHMLGLAYMVKQNCRAKGEDKNIF